jgi:hypothetical protein
MRRRGRAEDFGDVVDPASLMHELLQQIFSGLAASAIYASLALALVMIYRHRTGQFRAGRNGDVFHLHSLDPCECRSTILG